MPTAKKPSLKRPNQWTLIIIAFGVVIIIFTALNIFSSMTPPPPAHTPPPQKNLTGMYKGSLPCADCSVIEETLTLAGTEPTSGNYILEDIYKGKSTAPVRSQGKWAISNDTIKLTPGDKSNFSYFLVLNNGNLQMLDSDMKKIDSPIDQTLIRQN